MQKISRFKVSFTITVLLAILAIAYVLTHVKLTAIETVSIKIRPGITEPHDRIAIGEHRLPDYCLIIHINGEQRILGPRLNQSAQDWLVFQSNDFPVSLVDSIDVCETDGKRCEVLDSIRIGEHLQYSGNKYKINIAVHKTNRAFWMRILYSWVTQIVIYVLLIIIAVSIAAIMVFDSVMKGLL